MPNTNDNKDSWSLSSAFKTANGFTLKYLGLMGLPFYAFFAKSASVESAINPDATLFDVGANFYSGMYDALIEDFIPGTSFILSEIFNTVADIAIPGMSMAIQALEMTDDLNIL